MTIKSWLAYTLTLLAIAYTLWSAYHFGWDNHYVGRH